MFLIPLDVWTPEIIKQQDVPESFGLFVSYSTGYQVLRFLEDGTFDYFGPIKFSDEIVESATEADIFRYRRFVSRITPSVISVTYR